MPANAPILQWRGRRVWLIGASSGIGEALASALHDAGAQVTVSARRAQALNDFVTRHPGSHAVTLDVCDAHSVATATAEVAAQGGLDVVVYCVGHYLPMRASALDLPELLRHVDINYQGALRVLAAALPHMASSSHLSLVASVAGYRGLPRALAYGPTKAALIHLADILHMDLSERGIGVSVINPGFVATPLTAQNDFEMPALMQPVDAARAIVRGWARGEFEIHFPKRFSRFLKALRWLPDAWYFKLIRRATGM